MSPRNVRKWSQWDGGCLVGVKDNQQDIGNNHFIIISLLLTSAMHVLEINVVMSDRWLLQELFKLVYGNIYDLFLTLGS